MLYIISTPIGNLKDITLRGIDILESVDILLCEDTRNSGLLLQKLNIKNKPKLVSFYDEVEDQKVPEVIKYLNEGLEVGLISDAGTPLLSDPGWKLIKRCQQLGIKYTAIPGVSAAIDALVLSGLPGSRFSFLGFLPKKDGDRKRVLEKYKDIEGVKIVYESPFRLVKLLADIKEIYGDETKVSICREMTKFFEEVVKGTVSELLLSQDKKIKGEIVVVFE
jgi:16S rRNA (cytidine1402-2'-O)-methyltransferase